MNLTFAYDNTLALFGRSAWITGGFICLTMMVIYSATPENTRRGQFEIFWYSHHCFVLFFIFILFHGKGGINPHYWSQQSDATNTERGEGGWANGTWRRLKQLFIVCDLFSASSFSLRVRCLTGRMYAIPTMTIYITERILRVYRASLPVSILSISLMDDVLSLEFAKAGSVFEFEQYKEGQYLFLLSPPISRIQWHPFTISSAPQESTVTVHIRVMGEGSWTRGLQQYMSTMGPQGKSYIKLDRLGPSGKLDGKITGPDGRAIIQIDAPHSAPTQHVGEYSSVMVVGAGIGATPVCSTLKSVVFHKWRVNVGECFPAHAYFMWVCAYRDIDAFRWLIRTIKEAQDEVVHMRANNAQSMAAKTFEFHIFLTSAPKTPKPVQVVVDDEIGSVHNNTMSDTQEQTSRNGTARPMPCAPSDGSFFFFWSCLLFFLLSFLASGAHRARPTGWTRCAPIGMRSTCTRFETTHRGSESCSERGGAEIHCSFSLVFSPLFALCVCVCSCVCCWR